MKLEIIVKDQIDLPGWIVDPIDSIRVKIETTNTRPVN